MFTQLFHPNLQRLTFRVQAVEIAYVAAHGLDILCTLQEALQYSTLSHLDHTLESLREVRWRPTVSSELARTKEVRESLEIIIRDLARQEAQGALITVEILGLFLRALQSEYRPDVIGDEDNFLYCLAEYCRVHQATFIDPLIRRRLRPVIRVYVTQPA